MKIDFTLPSLTGVRGFDVLTWKFLIPYFLWAFTIFLSMDFFALKVINQVRVFLLHNAPFKLFTEGL